MPIGVRKDNGSLRQLSPEEEAIYVREQAALRQAGVDARVLKAALTRLTNAEKDFARWDKDYQRERTAYVTHRQAMGMRFRTEARILQSFSRALGEVKTIQEITADQLLAFPAGTGNWERKHSALGGLYRFAVARGYVDHSRLSRTVPQPQEVFVPVFARARNCGACSMRSQRLTIHVAALVPTPIGRSCSCFMAQGCA
jgi:hypothetical protein